MNTATAAAIAAFVGPFLLFVTWVLSRKQVGQQADADYMTATVNASLATTETMRTLLEPLEREVRELRNEILQLRRHVMTLETQIKELGATPASAPEITPNVRNKR